MKMIRIKDKAYKYLKHISKVRDETMPESFDYIIDVFQQIPKHAIIPLSNEPNAPYMTCKVAFYEQNKHKLEEHQRKFFESAKSHMTIFFKERKKELMVFKATYALTKKSNLKDMIKKYNKEYYVKRKEKLQ